MLNNVALGTYYPGQSLLHRLQARTKLLLLVWIAVWLMIANQNEWHFAPYIVLVLLFCAAGALSGIAVREIWRRVWFVVVLIVLGSLTTPFTTQGDDRVLHTIGPLFTSYGVVREVLLLCGLPLLAILLTSALPVEPLSTFWQHRWFRFLRIPLIMLILVIAVAFWLVSGPPAPHPLTLGPLHIFYGGTWLLVTSSGLLAIYGFSVLLTMTTTPVALIEGMRMLLSPLRRLKLPVDDFSLMTLLALRFIPTLLEEIEQLTKAQAARGADLAEGTLRERLQSLTMVFVPLMSGALRRASELATALEARGYQVEGQQTMLHESSLQWRDYLVLSTVALVTVGTLFLS